MISPTMEFQKETDYVETRDWEEYYCLGTEVLGQEFSLVRELKT